MKFSLIIVIIFCAMLSNAQVVYDNDTCSVPLFISDQQVYNPPCQECDVFYDYSDTTGWTQVGSLIEITNDQVNFFSGSPPSNSGGSAIGTQRRLYTDLGMTLDSSSNWTASFEFTPVSVGISPLSGLPFTGHVLLGLTAGSEEFLNDCPDLPCTGFPVGDQNGLLVEFSTNDPYGSSLPYFIVRAKDSLNETFSNKIYVSPLGTTYYVTLTKTSKTNVRLSVFSDSNRMYQIGGSPVNFTIPVTLDSLNTIQHGVIVSGDSYKALTGSLDNLCFKNLPTDPHYFSFEVADTSQYLHLGEVGIPGAFGMNNFDFNIYYVGNEFDYCDSLLSGNLITYGVGVSDTNIFHAFDTTGVYLLEITNYAQCPEIYASLTDTICDENAGNYFGDINCQSGNDLYDGYSQSMCFNDTECSFHWYNLCITDTTEMTVTVNSAMDSATFSLYVFNSHYQDSINCPTLDESGILGGYIILDVFQASQNTYSNLPPGSYNIGFVTNSSYAYNCADIEFNFDTDVVPCSIGHQCPENDTCSNFTMVEQCVLFNGFCDTCALSSDPYYFGFNIAEDNSFIVINENVNSNSFHYTITRWDSLVDICSGAYFSDTVATGFDSLQVVVHIDSGGYYVLVLDSLRDCPSFDICQVSPPSNCESCIQSFAPIPGEKYLIGAWVLDQNAHDTITNYSDPQIFLHFALDEGGGSVGDTTFGPYSAQGNIIDGWQRIEELFKIPDNALDMEIELTTLGDSALFDDIRVFPFNASMKTFVYDPVNMRLSAELDERHYATFYEYDEEGKLVRIKKETEKGVMTIQETKSNAKKE